MVPAFGPVARPPAPVSPTLCSFAGGSFSEPGTGYRIGPSGSPQVPNTRGDLPFLTTVSPLPGPLTRQNFEAAVGVAETFDSAPR